MTEETKQTIEHSPGVKITLIKGAKEYRWELEIRDKDDDLAFDRADRLDTRMQERWPSKKVGDLTYPYFHEESNAKD